MLIQSISSLSWLLEQNDEQVVLTPMAVLNLVSLMKGDPPERFHDLDWKGSFLGRDWRWVDRWHLEGWTAR